MRSSKRLTLSMAVAATLLGSTTLSAAVTPQPAGSSQATHKVGVVDFRQAVESSKYGQQEQDSLEAMQTQMMNQMEATQKELQEVAGKLQDREYIDGISPEAEQQLQMKGQQLSETLQAQSQQFRMILQQAQMKMVQSLQMQVQNAARSIAKDKGLDLVMQEEALFYFVPDYDITDEVIATMDKTYESEVQSNGNNS